MGTRNLTVVKANNKVKVAQYGQWDGYPEGVGQDIVDFLTSNTNNLDELKRRILEIKEITEDEHRSRWSEAGADPNSEFVSMDVSNKFKQLYPELSRDTSGGILLKHIMSRESDADPLRVKKDLNFGTDSLFCEWAYLLDLDENLLYVYEGFQEEPHDQGIFVKLEGYEDKSNEYYPCKPVAKFDISKDNLQERWKTWMESLNEEDDE